jgi:hypothetical protein
MTTLSICIPSHARLVDARASIDSARALLSHNGIEVVVSDNSRDVEKANYYKLLQENNFRYLESLHNNGMDNWRNAIDAATGEFIMMLGDDDILVALPGFSVPQPSDLRGLIGFRPTFALFSPDQGIYRPTNFNVQGERAVDRVKDYIQKNGGSNVTIYSGFRRDAWQSLFTNYIVHHPTRAGYTDWSLMLALASAGPVGLANGLVYLYNNSNWDSEEKVSASNHRLAATTGLPPEAVQIQPAFQAIDAFVAICRFDSPVPREEKIDAGLLVTEAYFSTLLKVLNEHLDLSKPPSERLLATAKIALDARHPLDQLTACLSIINLWVPTLREPYQIFLDTVLDPAIGKSVGLTRT